MPYQNTVDIYIHPEFSIQHPGIVRGESRSAVMLGAIIPKHHHHCHSRVHSPPLSRYLVCRPSSPLLLSFGQRHGQAENAADGQDRAARHRHTGHRVCGGSGHGSPVTGHQVTGGTGDTRVHAGSARAAPSPLALGERYGQSDETAHGQDGAASHGHAGQRLSLHLLLHDLLQLQGLSVCRLLL